MSTMLTAEDRKLLTDFNRNIAWLKQKELKDSKNWVKSTVITEMTGWDNERMRRARNRGEVVWKKDDKGFWYSPESINPIHLKKQTA